MITLNSFRTLIWLDGIMFEERDDMYSSRISRMALEGDFLDVDENGLSHADLDLVTRQINKIGDRCSKDEEWCFLGEAIGLLWTAFDDFSQMMTVVSSSTDSTSTFPFNASFPLTE